MDKVHFPRPSLETSHGWCELVSITFMCMAQALTRYGTLIGFPIINNNNDINGAQVCRSILTNVALLELVLLMGKAAFLFRDVLKCQL
jgi:hypothetical protein